MTFTVLGIFGFRLWYVGRAVLPVVAWNLGAGLVLLAKRMPGRRTTTTLDPRQLCMGFANIPRSMTRSNCKQP